MNKIVLGRRPTSIRRAVEVLMPDGTKGVITANYTYRTRTEYADYIDSIVDKARAMMEAPPTEEEPVARPKRGGAKTKVAAKQAGGVRVSTEIALRTQAEQVLEILESWDLDVQLNLDNLIQLGDEMPGAIRGLIEGYRVAITEGHAGN